MQSNTFLGFIVGEKIITLQRVDSTNEYLKQMLSNSTPVAEGTAIMAVEQYRGKGQSGNTWETEAGKNLTFSILLKPSFLSPALQFKLNIAISLATCKFLTKKLPDQVRIKWPNDFYVDNKKIGGMLIENSIQGEKWKYAVVGIGLNINQLNFPPNRTSLAILLNRFFELPELLSELCHEINIAYQQLYLRQYDEQLEEYLSNLYRIGEESVFSLSGIDVRGKIVGIDPSGRLLVDFNGYVTDFGVKEISMES